MPTRLSQGSTSAKLTLALWLVAFAFVAPATIVSGQVSTWPEALTLITGMGTGIIFSMILFLVFRWVWNRPVWFRAFVMTLGVVAVSALQTLADFTGQHVVKAAFGQVSPPVLNIRTALLTTFIYLCLYGANCAIFWVVASLARSREKELELAHSRTRSAVLEMEKLRLQLDPHFLGNALNGVSTLIMANRAVEAAEMTDKLAAFLRTSLDDRGPLIPLRDELETVVAYVEIETVRFPERLIVTYDFDEEAEAALVPPFILQTLAENAVKHAVSVTSSPVHVRVSAKRQADELALEVIDDGANAPQTAPSGNGVGLRNTRERLGLQYGDAARFEAGPLSPGFRVAIHIPFSAGDVAPVTEYQGQSRLTA